MQLDRLQTLVASPNVPNSSHYKPNRSFELFQWKLHDIKSSCSATNFCGLDPLWPIQYAGITKVSIWAYQIPPNTWACTGCCYKHSQASLMETTRNVKLYVSYTFFLKLASCWSGKKFKHTPVLRSKCSRGVMSVTDSVLTFGLWHASSTILLWFTTFEPSVKSPHR